MIDKEYNQTQNMIRKLNELKANKKTLLKEDN